MQWKFTHQSTLGVAPSPSDVQDNPHQINSMDCNKAMKGIKVFSCSAVYLYLAAAVHMAQVRAGV
jgi:hypothetical protein